MLDRTGSKLGSVLDVFYEGAPGMEPGGRLWPQEEAAAVRRLPG